SGAGGGQGGNINLRPEQGDSTSLGVVFSPERWRHASFSMDWWNLNLTDRIMSVYSTILLANESLFSDLLAREPASAADQAAGIPGRVNRMMASYVNGGRAELAGVDFRANYRVPLWNGQVDTSLNLAYTYEYRA